MHIRRLTTTDAVLFRQLRLAALQETPSAFGSSLDEESSKSLADFAARLSGQAGVTVFGAFEADTLIGTVGLRREQQLKLAHKCILVGMYVHPQARGNGIGRALVSEAITFARSLPGVRQINLCVNANNPGPVHLYDAMGFVSWGLEKASLLVDGVLHDELHMVLPLA
jgi:RimJ/RimL family protein N-acetyltransferase